MIYHKKWDFPVAQISGQHEKLSSKEKEAIHFSVVSDRFGSSFYFKEFFLPFFPIHKSFWTCNTVVLSKIPLGRTPTLIGHICSHAADGIVVWEHFHEKASPLLWIPSLWLVVVMMEGGRMRKMELERRLFCRTCWVVNLEDNDAGEKAVWVWCQCHRYRFTV